MYISKSNFNNKIIFCVCQNTIFCMYIWGEGGNSIILQKFSHEEIKIIF